MGSKTGFNGRLAPEEKDRAVGGGGLAASEEAFAGDAAATLGSRPRIGSGIAEKAEKNRPEATADPPSTRPPCQKLRQRGARAHARYLVLSPCAWGSSPHFIRIDTLVPSSLFSLHPSQSYEHILKLPYYLLFPGGIATFDSDA